MRMSPCLTENGNNILIAKWDGKGPLGIGVLHKYKNTNKITKIKYNIESFYHGGLDA